MNNEEIESLIKQLKAQGLSEEQIMEVFYETFTDGKMDKKDLETLADAMGYELADDFKNEPAPDPISADGVEGMSKEDLEDAKAIEPGESTEEFKEELEGAKDELGAEEAIETEEKGEEKTEEFEEETEEPKEDEEEKSDEGAEEEKEESEDEEWEKAQKMFKI